MSTTTTTTAADIITRKHQVGAAAYLYVHDSGDVILWASEAESENDDGARAIARWHVDGETVAALMATGEVNA